MMLLNVYAVILSKLLITLMGISRLGAAIYTATTYECTESMLNNFCHAWDVVSQ